VRNLNSSVIERAELLGGQRFTWSPRTPYLSSIIGRAEDHIARAVQRAAPHARVVREPDLLLTAQAAVIPDIVVFPGPTWNLPLLVIEYRAESTDRLFFGPKRLAYARARVPEVWFVDAVRRDVTALRLDSGLDYPWPAAHYTGDAHIRSASIAGLDIPIASFYEDRADERP